MSLESLRDLPPYQAELSVKQGAILSGLNELTNYHYSKCVEYRRIINGYWGADSLDVSKIEDVPFLPVSLFKELDLKSITEDENVITLTSSGTTGQAVSRISVDRETSTAQQKCLANSIGHILGKRRLPMLVADTAEVIKDPKLMSARGAGVLGMMRFGVKPVFMLDADGQPAIDDVRKFLAAYGAEPFFIFGFTFLVWSILSEQFRDAGLDLAKGTLIHSGGWKKMVEKAVGPEEFKAELKRTVNLSSSYNFYGMVEQIGSIFVEGDDGLLYAPNYSDVIIRDEKTWQPCPVGVPGIIQVVSLLPKSYPGHSLLTEDLGVIESVSKSGRFIGKGLRVIGRVKKAELRGCSDVIAAAGA